VAGCSFLLKRTPFRYWIYLFLIGVPFDLGAPLGYIPRISVIDYLSLAGLIAILLKFSSREIIAKVKASFGWPLLCSWFVYLLYDAVSGLILHGSFKGVFRWGETLFVYWIAVLAVQEDRKRLAESAGWILTGLGALMAAWALIQYVRSGLNYTLTYAIFEQHNILGAYLSLCLPVSWVIAMTRSTKSFRIAGGMLSGLITISFLAAYSRGAWLGLLGALILIFVLSWQKLRSPVFSLSVGFLLILAGAAAPISWIRYREHLGRPPIVDSLSFDVHQALSDHTRIFTTSQRAYYWKAASDIFREHPLMGLGPKNFDSQISGYLIGRAKTIYVEDLQFNGRVNFWQHLHNEYLQVLVENGLIGLILWAAAFSLLALPLFRADILGSNPLFCAFQVSGLAFILHNSVDILFVNSLDIVFVILIAILRQAEI